MIEAVAAPRTNRYKGRSAEVLNEVRAAKVLKRPSSSQHIAPEKVLVDDADLAGICEERTLGLTSPLLRHLQRAATLAGNGVSEAFASSRVAERFLSSPSRRRHSPCWQLCMM